MSDNSISGMGSMFLGFWLMGGSFISLSAAMVFFKFQGNANLDAYLVYTILGGVFLVLGIFLIGLTLIKNRNKDITMISKPVKSIMILTILIDSILIIVANVA